ncbi:histidine kinase dimerization/phosphoacceptor domain -containing protein [Telmatospirillum sp.]|uniref:sensor histidine kinase n=1 Tax=Telmatospirillum sp. TaxID=2079197 RepID=UPI002847CD37|nr:histidine kinase dimerization/phosphoacceptor domain -containing protein [Telmatospirillum sp.]MDR3435820.1 histidine kinase dimerization/phosphoacceptor domain -containing protein [Telmatospirillum sp.]
MPKKLRDDTRDLLVESALRKSEERFRLVVESAPNAMVMTNDRGVIEMVNAQAERLFGYARQELLGQPIEMLVPGRFRAQHPNLRTAFHAAPQSRPMGAGRDLFALRKDGREVPVEIGLNPIETDEGVMVLSAIVDISDRKQKEERIRAALKEKDILLGEIHHRVKNNLQIVSSLLDLQSVRVTDPMAFEVLRDCQRRVRTMASIHQILYQSRDVVQVNFESFLEDLVPTLMSAYVTDPERISLSVGAVNVHLPIGSAIPCGLIVNELMSNALKHGFPGDRRGEIRVEFVYQSENQVALSISDNGVGIAADLDIASTETLGLQLVTMLTDQLGGTLQIKRANPTRFLLHFPIDR